jgi:hypothetical protein
LTNPRPTDLAASVRQRLKNIADATDRPFAEVLQWYAIERFLARFSRTAHRETYLLKGAALLRVWQEIPARPTMDVDLGVRGVISEEEAKCVIADSLEVEIEPDGLHFDHDSIETAPIRVALDYPGVRIRCRGKLGTAKVALQIDIGFGDSVVPKPEPIEYPTLLEFPPPQVIAYRPETVIAEKLEAIVNLGLRTSRMKDYFDLWWLTGNRKFDGAVMAEALSSTFSRRKSSMPQDVPVGLSGLALESEDKKRQWRAFLRRMRHEQEGTSFQEVVEQIRTFATPIFFALSRGQSFSEKWLPGKGWR